MSKLLLAQEIVQKKKQIANNLMKIFLNNNIIPTLAIISIDPQEAEIFYEDKIKKNILQFNAKTKNIHMKKDTTTMEFCCELKKINDDKSIHGCLILQPLPKQIDMNLVRKTLSPKKDVDGLTLSSLGSVFANIIDNDLGFIPSTAEACIDILDHYNIDVSGKNVVVVGSSLVVGRPIAIMLSNRKATVTICNSKTQKLANICKQADIIISAAGECKLIDVDFLNPNQVIIDVGINFDSDGKLCGDVNYQKAYGFVKAITPVPGGVGAITTLNLINNLFNAAQNLLEMELTKSGL